MSNLRAGKSAILSELLGKDRYEALIRSGAIPGIKPSEPDTQSLEWHRNRLIEKLRDRGLFTGSTAAALKTTVQPDPTPEKPVSPAQAGSPKFASSSICSRLAANLDPNRLSDEHPAVLAVLLRSQPPQTRSEVLRGLPGPQARAVMRILRAGRSEQATVKTPAGAKNVASGKGKEEKQVAHQNANSPSTPQKPDTPSSRRSR